MSAHATSTPPLMRSLGDSDPDIARAIANETARQAHGLELIASENFVSTAVLEAAGSVFTNKYAEGYPGRRYYGGCEQVDVVESLAIARAMSGSLSARLRCMRDGVEVACALIGNAPVHRPRPGAAIRG